MSKADPPTAVFRLTVRKPAPGAIYSLQGKDGAPLGARKSAGRPMVFKIPARIGEHASGPRVLGDFVRTEGKTRRFFYLASGKQAGDPDAEGGRRAKIDFPTISPALLALAVKGALVMEAGVDGVGKDGAPIAGSVQLFPDWTIAKA